MVLLLEVDCLDINFGLGEITDSLVSLLVNRQCHVFSSQHCFTSLALQTWLVVVCKLEGDQKALAVFLVQRC